MGNRILLFTLLFTLLWSCTPDSLQEERTSDDFLLAQQEPLSTGEIDEIVMSTLRENGTFKWDMVSDEVAWSALVQSDSLLSIGYKPAAEKDINDRMHLINLDDPQWRTARLNVMKKIVELQNDTENLQITLDDLEVWVSDRLPYIQIKTGNFEVFKAVRAMPEIRYAEPMGYGRTLTPDPAYERNGSGCGQTALPNLPAGDYSTYGNNGILPWNYNTINVQNAWQQAQGDNITIGLIDTGVSDDQDNLGSKFATGNSTGRYIEKHSTFVTCTGWWWWKSCTNDGPNDQCGHGTGMASFMSAPLGTNSQSMMGVAYKSNLIAYRATGDVVINSSNERQGVSDALYELGWRNDVDIISMSIGDLFSNGQVADAVVYAYNKGKLIFAAAGTSTWFTNWAGVIFPANMSQCVAVTGVTDHPTNLVECGNCHYGSKVEFSIVMQRHGDSDRTSLTLANTHDTPTNDHRYSGGSSCATATTAGIAAVVWSKNPGQSRSAVLNKLKQASSEYPNKDSDFGWGVIDAGGAASY